MSWASYTTTNTNRMDSTSLNVNQRNYYDAAGNVLYDGRNTYLYDADGRICAVSSTFNGTTFMTGYLYDAEGRRIAKGSIQNMNSCNPATNGFQVTSAYVLGPSGEQMTEVEQDADGDVEWQHTNVRAGGMLLATYQVAGPSLPNPNDPGNPLPNSTLHFYLNDPLGTRRVQTDYAGVIEQTCQSLPYGDGESCSPSPTEHLFTGKERDAESGNDYFGARYYASAMGRFMSPDPSRLSILPSNPQTWNRYSYVYNNPLGLKDNNGKWPTETHNQIIDNAFPTLTPAQRQILKNVSAEQDGLLNGGQSEGLSFQHAMRSPGQTVQQAQSDYNDFVSGEETAAGQEQMIFWMSDPDNKLDQVSDQALEEFGHALHAILDSTSPAHEGFQVWDYNPAHIWAHHNAEKAPPTAQQMLNAVTAAQLAWQTTFSQFGIQVPKEKACVTTEGPNGPETTCD